MNKVWERKEERHIKKKVLEMKKDMTSSAEKWSKGDQMEEGREVRSKAEKS
jgi:hypothetical protein